MLVAAPIGMVVGEVAMLFIYLGIFLPIGIVFRVWGRDRLKRKKPTGSVASYWQEKEQPRTVASYYRQS